MKTAYQDIIDINHIASYESRENMNDILALGQLENITPALQDTSRITLLEDCMSPIAGFEISTKQQFEALREQYGIHIRKSTEITL